MAGDLDLDAAERELTAGIDALQTHGGRQQPAPHKPLLMMWAIRRRLELGQSKPRLFRYEETERGMCALLAAAGRGVQPRPWYPFVRLRSAPFWELRGDIPLNSSGDVSSVRALMAPDVAAGYSLRFDRLLLAPDRASSIEQHILGTWIDESTKTRVIEVLNGLSWEA